VVFTFGIDEQLGLFQSLPISVPHVSLKQMLIITFNMVIVACISCLFSSDTCEKHHHHSLQNRNKVMFNHGQLYKRKLDLMLHQLKPSQTYFP